MYGTFVPNDQIDFCLLNSPVPSLNPFLSWLLQPTTINFRDVSEHRDIKGAPAPKLLANFIMYPQLLPSLKKKAINCFLMNLCLPHMTAHGWPAPPGTNPTLLSHRDSLPHTEVLSCHLLPLSASLEVYSAFFARQGLTSTSLAIPKMCLQRPLQLLHSVILSGPLSTLVMHSHQTLLSLYASCEEKTSKS